MKTSCTFLSLAFISLTACGSHNSIGQQPPLTTMEQHALWSGLPQNYRATFQQHCFCLPDYLRPIQLIVENDTIVSAIFEDDGSVVPAEIKADLPTVEKMFQALLAAEAIPAEKISVEFDQQHHYPRSIFIDYNANLADEEIRWQFSKLVLQAE